jgi:hypothetical protein
VVFSVTFENRGAWTDCPLGSGIFAEESLRSIAAAVTKCRDAESSLLQTARGGIRPYAISVLTLPEKDGKTVVSASLPNSDGVVFHLTKNYNNGWNSTEWDIFPKEFYEFVARIPSIVGII